MNCLIVDDSKIARTAIKKLIQKVGFLTLQGECESPEEAFNYLKAHDVDLIFLDVELPGMSGLELIRTMEKRPMVILVTSKKEYAVEAYELNVVDYLVKPVSLPRFLSAVNRAKELNASNDQQIDVSDKNYIFVRSNSTLSKIMLDDILYIQALGDYVNIFTFEKKYTVHLTLRTLEERLPASKFFRLHRSYMAAIDHIDTVEENTAYIHGNPVPVGELMKPTLLKKINLL